MKSIFKNIAIGLLINLGLFISRDALSQDLFSYYQGKKQFYSTSDNKIVVRFKKEINVQTKNAFIDNQLVESSKNEENGFTFLLLKADIGKEKIKNFVEIYKQSNHVLSVSPVLLSEKGEEIGGLTEQFIVRLKAKPLQIFNIF